VLKGDDEMTLRERIEKKWKETPLCYDDISLNEIIDFLDEKFAEKECDHKFEEVLSIPERNIRIECAKCGFIKERWSVKEPKPDINPPKPDNLVEEITKELETYAMPISVNKKYLSWFLANMLRDKYEIKERI
jgi:hypothetical protein